MSASSIFSLRDHPVHLGRGACVVVQEEFTGSPEWYARYGERNAADGVDGRLVTLHRFDAPSNS